MFKFFKKNKKNKENNDNLQTNATMQTTIEEVNTSIKKAQDTYIKPDYTGNRNTYDCGRSKEIAKKNAFNNGEVFDNWSGKKLHHTNKEAMSIYGKDGYMDHVAHADHITPLENIVTDIQENSLLKKSWVTSADVKEIANSPENFEIISGRTNTSKGKMNNKEFAEYREKNGYILSEEHKQRKILEGENSKKIINDRLNNRAIKNMAQNFHSSGIKTAVETGKITTVISTITNIKKVISGEIEADEALLNITKDGGKAALIGYGMGGSLSTVGNMMSNSKSAFIQSLGKANVPGNIITAVLVTGNTLKSYANGEITTEECIIQLGEKGLGIATTGYSMALGQSLIPIPIVGAAVGALFGSMVTSNYYNYLVNSVKQSQLESEERKKIIRECEETLIEVNKLNSQLKEYAYSYFKDYKGCFDEALGIIHEAFKNGDANGIIAGANQITKKLGGKVYYENTDQFNDFLFSDEIDEF